MTNPLESPRKLALYVVACVCFAVHGEESVAAENPSAGAVDAGDILVTAQRRAERSHDVPMFINALSGKSLAQMWTTDTARLGKVVPSLYMTRAGAFTQPYLRGVGKRSGLGVENSVATYIDGVYLASAITALLDLQGIDRIEVLNGPQGTLFGRNSIGGVIQIITREPSRKTSGEWSLRAGSYGYARGDVYITGGSERLAGNLAASISRNGGYGRNLYSGKSDGDAVRHSVVLRSKWVWRPANSLKMTLAADYQDIDHDFSYLPVAGFVPIGHPRIMNFRDRDQDGSNRYAFRYGGFSLKADVGIGSTTLMSLTALRRMRARYNGDLDRGPQLLWQVSPTARQDQVSQEFQLKSSDHSSIRWIAGLYYIKIEERYDPYVFHYGGSYSALRGGLIQQTIFDSGDVASYAAYGQAVLSIARTTSLRIGSRYTIEHRSVRANGEQRYDNEPFVRPIPGLPLLTQSPLRDSVTFRDLSWRVSLDKHFSDQLMAYVLTSRGFQSGGWNLQTPQNPVFRPERLDDFEAGLKFVDSSQRFGAEANIFYYDYSDLQLSTFTQNGLVTTNAASARLYGLGLQVHARPDRATDIQFGLQLLNARFRHFRNASCTRYDPTSVNPFVLVPCDATGNYLPYAPKIKLSLSANHRFVFGAVGSVVLSGNMVYNSGYYSDPDNRLREKSFTTIDASAEWQPRWQGPSIQFWVLNLANTHYYDNLISQPPAGMFQRPAAPRRLGVSILGSF